MDVTALLGRLAAQRAQLLRTLEAEGCCDGNAARPVPEVPLHVGLVASPGTEGYRDFLGQLTGSGFGFRVHVPVTVQGRDAPAAVAAAVTALCRRDCDLVVVVRGGGARADLAAFESEVVARAVAGATKPVFTGIGHTGDESVADLVANRVCITPTECGHQIVQTGHWWAAHVASRRAPVPTGPALAARVRVRGHPRPWSPHGGGPAQLRVHRERLAGRGRTGRSAPDGRSRTARHRAHAARSGRWPDTSTGRPSGCSRGTGCWPPMTWTVSSSAATASR